MYFGLESLDPSDDTICLFLEFLARSFTSHKSISNYLSAVRILHKRLNLKGVSLHSYQVKLLLRAYQLTIGGPKPRCPVTLQLMFELTKLCDSIGTKGVVLKCVFLFAFFGFLRCSNLVPQTKVAFCKKKTLVSVVLTS